MIIYRPSALVGVFAEKPIDGVLLRGSYAQSYSKGENKWNWISVPSARRHWPILVTA